MKIRGSNGLIFDVPDSVATGLIASGETERVVEDEKPKRTARSRKGSDNTEE